MEFPFEGIPTIPPRKDMEHLAFFCDGCRYRCETLYRQHLVKQCCSVQLTENHCLAESKVISVRLFQQLNSGCGTAAAAVATS